MIVGLLTYSPTGGDISANIKTISLKTLVILGSFTFQF